MCHSRSKITERPSHARSNLCILYIFLFLLMFGVSVYKDLELSHVPNWIPVLYNKPDFIKTELVCITFFGFIGRVSSSFVEGQTFSFVALIFFLISLMFIYVTFVSFKTSPSSLKTKFFCKTYIVFRVIDSASFRTEFRLKFRTVHNFGLVSWTKIRMLNSTVCGGCSCELLGGIVFSKEDDC
jgi:hypothetical protein